MLPLGKVTGKPTLWATPMQPSMSWGLASMDYEIPENPTPAPKPMQQKWIPLQDPIEAKAKATSKELSPDQFRMMVEKAKTRGVDEKQFFMDMVKSWYTVAKEQKPWFFDKVSTGLENKKAENPLLRAWKSLLGGIYGTAKWFVKGIFGGAKDFWQDAKRIIADPSKNPAEKFNQILFGEWIADYIGNKVIWWTIGGGLEWLYKWFTTQSERNSIDSGVKKVFESVVNKTEADEKILEAYNSLSDYQKQEMNDLIDYWLGATNFVWLWLTGWAKKWAQEAVEQGTKWLIKATTPVVWKVDDVVDATAKSMQNKTNRVAEKLVDSKLKITKPARKWIKKATGMSPSKFILENDLAGNTIEETIKKTDDLINESMAEKFMALESIKSPIKTTQRDKLMGRSIVQNAKEDIQSLYGKSFDEVLPDEVLPELQETFNIVKNVDSLMQSDNMTALQKEAMKSLYDLYNSHLKYDLTKKRVLSSQELIRKGLKEEIETIGKQVGVDIWDLNSKISAWYSLKRWLEDAGERLANNNVFGLSDTQTALLSAVLGGSPVEVAVTALWKNIFDKVWFRLNLAKRIFTKSKKNAVRPKVPVSGRATAGMNISSQLGSVDSVGNTSAFGVPTGWIKWLPYKDDAMTFGVSKARMGNTEPRKYQVTELGKAKAPGTTKWLPKKESLPTKIIEKANSVKKNSTGWLPRSSWKIESSSENIEKFAIENADRILVEYQKVLKEKKLPPGYINPDEMRIAINKVRWWELMSTQNHEWASKLSKILFKRIQEWKVEWLPKNNKALLVAWWPWSGKTSVLQLPELPIDDYKMIVDKVWPITEFWLLKDTTDVDWVFVNTKVNDALDRALWRTISWNEKWFAADGKKWMWRVVNFKNVIEWHKKARETTKQVFNLKNIATSDAYDNVRVLIVDNTWEKWTTQLLQWKDLLKELEKIDIDLQSVSIENVSKKAKQALDNGKITRQQYDAMIASLLPVLIVGAAAYYTQDS